MQKLVKGLHAFKVGYFTKHQRLFEQLATAGQKPETLFITCCDSRVVPNLITQTAPGELFIVRNIGNIVPGRDLPGGTSAAIEYAVEVLGIENIIVCGHTQCGAMQAVLDPATVAHLPSVKRWVARAERVREVIEERYSHLSGDARVTAAVEENVLVQLENLRDFPFVAERLDAGTLHLNGWVYHIGRGEIYDYDPTLGEFTRLVGDQDEAFSSPLASSPGAIAP
ncbi:MAG: carbonic anhydrase [Polyangiaceae bacterium]